MKRQWHAAGTAVDIAVVPDASSAAFGLAENSAFLILTEGDLSGKLAHSYTSSQECEKIGTAQALRMLLQRSSDHVDLSPTAQRKVSSLESEGWKVHRVHHDLLNLCYKLRFSEE